MHGRLKSAGRVALHGVIWVFVLSIRIEGRTLFHHAHDVLVDNPVVAAIETQISRGFHSVMELAGSGAGRLIRGLKGIGNLDSGKA